MELPSPRAGGSLVINADDWGRDQGNTNSILACVEAGAISTVSAMVFMKDSERSAAIARERGIEAGLHLNLTTTFSVPDCPQRLLERQDELARYLLRHRLAQVVFHPGLIRSFEYVVSAQLREFHRLYGEKPKRIDGHHHMHLCANVLWQDLLPCGAVVRRNFSFDRGEKSPWNLIYRNLVDRRLARRHRLVDFFFSLSPMEPRSRLARIFGLAQHSIVEVETHPINPQEFTFLSEGEILRWSEDLALALPSTLA